MPDQSPTRDALSRSPRPLSRRTGHSSRAWDTRVDTMELRLSKVRGGSYFPSPLKPRRRSTKASLVIIQQTTWQPFSPLGYSPALVVEKQAIPTECQGPPDVGRVADSSGYQVIAGAKCQPCLAAFCRLAAGQFWAEYRLLRQGNRHRTGTCLLLKTATRRWPLRCRFFEYEKPDLGTVSIKSEKNKTFVQC